MREYTIEELNVFLVETASKMTQLKTELYCLINGIECYVKEGYTKEDWEYTDEAFEISSNFYEQIFQDLSEEFL